MNLLSGKINKMKRKLQEGSQEKPQHLTPPSPDSSTPNTNTNTPTPHESTSRGKQSTGSPEIAFQPILTRSTPVDEDSLDSFGEKSSESEELDVIEMAEDVQYASKVALGNLSRIGFRKSLWCSKWGSYCVMLTFLLNFQSLTFYARNINTHGMAFVFANVLTTLFVGFPLMYLEFALGQYTSSNAMAVFERISPAFSGLGIASILCNFIALIADASILPYFVSLFVTTVNMFANEMPWHHCSSFYNDESCRLAQTASCSNKAAKGWLQNAREKKMGPLDDPLRPFGGACIRVRDEPFMTVTAPKEYSEWLKTDAEGQLLLADINFDDLSHHNWPTQGALFFTIIAWLCVAVCASASRGKIVLLARTALVMMVTVIFSLTVVCIFTNPPAFAFIDAFQGKPFTPKYDQVFVAAMRMTFVALKLGQSKFIFVGSQSNFHNNIFQDCLVIVILVSVIPFCYAIIYMLTLDSFLLELVGGNMIQFYDHAKNALDTYIVQTNFQIFEFSFFVIAVRVYKSYETFILLAFSLMGLLISIGSKVVELEILLTSITESSEIFSDFRSRTTILTGVLCCCGIVVGSFSGRYGMELLVGLMNVTISLIGLFIVICEVLLVAYLYGAKRMIANTTAMSTVQNRDQRLDTTKKIFNVLMMFAWCVLCPICLFTSFFMRQYMPRDAHDAWLSRFLAIGVLLIIPIVLVFKVLKCWQKGQTFRLLFIPDPDFWGPRSKFDRERAERIERQIRDIV